MTISIRVRDYSDNDISQIVAYQPLVAWDRRHEYPMLAHIDRYGVTIFNGAQATTLREELEHVEALIIETGIDTAILRLGMEEMGSVSRIDGFSVKTDMPELIAEIKAMCTLTEAKPHRKMWFIGD